MISGEFSAHTRQRALDLFREEEFDLLVIGGGITGAATARDAASRGLKVALVEKRDFAWGTSSRSSKLIHGGLRYLENFELHLVFEALAERTLLLKSVPNLVRPLPFFFPVYQGDPKGKGILGLGLWLYDLLTLFHTPGWHKRLSTQAMLREIPFLKAEGLQGGFRYFDASMWDDALAVETLRAAHQDRAAVANYVEAVAPLWNADRIVGFRVRDLEKPAGSGEIDLRAKRTVVCAGPWTDRVGQTLGRKWEPWLTPSKGVHLIFDLKRIPIPGAMVMTHPDDGRIAFVIPRRDFGTGVVIVGTTDGPSPTEPEKASVEEGDVAYLMDLLSRYFPSLKLQVSDILSAYVGVRPLVGSQHGGENQKKAALQKVSREHHIGNGPGGTVLVAGGKYTTHRKMAEEIVDFTLKSWTTDAKSGRGVAVPAHVGKSRTKTPVNPRSTPAAIADCRAEAERKGLEIPPELLSRYGAEAPTILELHASLMASHPAFARVKDPEAFPCLAAQLLYSMRTGMVLHLEDFYLRREPLFSTRSDHGLPWAEMLSQIWAEERGLGAAEAAREVESLRAELARRDSWRASAEKGAAAASASVTAVSRGPGSGGGGESQPRA